MPTVPATRTFVAGEVVLASYFNTYINGPIGYLLAPPIFQGRQTSSQTLTTGTFTAVTFDAEDVDSAGGHSTSSNTSRYTAQYAGWYQGGGGCAFAANATGRRMSRFAVNGTTLNGSMAGIPANAATIPYALRPTFIFLNLSDYMEQSAFQDSGGNLGTFITNGEYQPTMNARFISN